MQGYWLKVIDQCNIVVPEAAPECTLQRTRLETFEGGINNTIVSNSR
jgi:hypothetical protein